VLSSYTAALYHRRRRPPPTAEGLR